MRIAWVFKIFHGTPDNALDLILQLCEILTLTLSLSTGTMAFSALSYTRTIVRILNTVGGLGPLLFKGTGGGGREGQVFSESPLDS